MPGALILGTQREHSHCYSYRRVSHGNHDLLPMPTLPKAGRKRLRELSNLLPAALLINLKQKLDFTACWWLCSTKVAEWGGERQGREGITQKSTIQKTIWTVLGSGNQSHIVAKCGTHLSLELRRDICAGDSNRGSSPAGWVWKQLERHIIQTGS